MKTKSAKLREKLRALHARMGDFWWYSLILFCACRLADVLNAFVGLWLVPKYVPPSELGAVMPLANFASFLAIPITAFANTFRNELTRLSINKEFGKLKTLMRGVFIASVVFIFIATLVAHFVLPAFLERIRIAEGSLGLIIIATSFVSAIAPLYSNALQSLKKFKATAVISIIGAPIRLLTMLAAMPLRAISGYFIGQASVPVFNMAASVLALKKDLSVKAEPYWNSETIKKFSRLLLIFLLMTTSSCLFGLVESTIIRQRLSDLDSAGYYMATRFSEIATYLYSAMIFTFFPLAAEFKTNNKVRAAFILKSTVVNIIFCLIIAVMFCFIGRSILHLLPHADLYATYWWAIPWLIMITGATSLHGFYTTAEIAANRFGFLKWAIPLDVTYPIILLLVTGHKYLAGIIPSEWTEYLATHNIYSLSSMLWWMTAINIIKSMACLIAMTTKPRPITPSCQNSQ